MRLGWKLFLLLAVFYGIIDFVYWFMGGEVIGIIAIGLSAALALFICYYFWFTERRLGNVLPEDNDAGEISDSAGEIGFYSPHSWWPLPVGLSVTAAGLGLIIGWWLTLIAVGALLFTIVGFSLEYERPDAHSD